MEISWSGYSCFTIKGSQATIVTDPYSPDIGYSPGQLEAGIVTVSHQHPGHANTDAVGGEPKVLSGPGEYEISGVLIIGMRTFHDEEQGEVRGKNTIYLIEVDEMVVGHLGDLGHVLTKSQIEEIERVDILLLPVGGVSTINASMAAEVVRQLEPRVVIPMHYKTGALKRELEPVDRFLREMGSKEIEPRRKVSFTRANLPLTTQVFLLDC